MGKKKSKASPKGKQSQSAPKANDAAVMSNSTTSSPSTQTINLSQKEKMDILTNAVLAVSVKPAIQAVSFQDKSGDYR